MIGEEAGKVLTNRLSYEESKEAIPLVSVIAVCYNHSKFVVECLESIRNQTYHNLELIILDDYSTDDSVSVIKNWIVNNNVKCKLVCHIENKGICKTINEAISYGKGKYIALIATDDVWMLDKLEIQVRLMEGLSEDIGVIYSDALQMNEDGNLLPKMFLESHLKFSDIPKGDIFPVLLEQNFIPAMTTLIRRSCYDKVGWYDENLCYEDWDMWLRISQSYNFCFSPIISAKYRILSTSAIRTLAHTKSREFLKSNFIIYSKCLLSDKITENHERTIKSKLTEICRLNLVMQEVPMVIPPEDSFILADQLQLGGKVTAGRGAIPFLEKDGEYWGAPPDDETAIRELERLRRTGTTFIVFAWTAFWWLDYYAEFNSYLRSKFRSILENDRLIVFDLRKESLSEAHSARNYKDSVESGSSK